MPAEDPGPWTESSVWALQEAAGLPGKRTLLFGDVCGGLVPKICVKCGEFSQRRSMGEGEHVDVRQGGGLPSSCLVGTDIGLKGGDEAAYEKEDSASEEGAD